MNLRLMIFKVLNESSSVTIFTAMARTRDLLPARTVFVEEEELLTGDGTYRLQHEYMIQNTDRLRLKLLGAVTELKLPDMNLLLVAEESDSGMLWIERQCFVEKGLLIGGRDLSESVAGWYANAR